MNKYTTKVINLTFRSTDPVPQQHLRPLTFGAGAAAHLPGLYNTLTTLDEELTKVEGDREAMFHISRNIDSILAFSETSGEPVDLPTADGQSWASGVGAFKMEVEVTSTAKSGPIRHFVVAGYADRTIHMLEELTADTVLTINSVTEVKQHALGSSSFTNLVLTGKGGPDFDRVVLDPAAVLGAAMVPLLGLGDHDVVDVRATLSRRPMLADYAHVNPSCWVFEVIDAAYQASNRHHHAEQSPTNQEMFYYDMQRLCRTADQTRWLMQLFRGEDGHTTANFRYGDLNQIIEMPEGVVFYEHNPDRANPAFQYSPLEGSSVQRRAASWIANCIPAIMAEFGVAELGLNVRYNNEGLSVSTTHINAITGSVDKKHLDTMLEYINRQVFDVIAVQGIVPFRLVGNFTLFNVSVFSLCYDAYAAEDYAVPTFANALFTPLVGPGMGAIMEMGRKFNEVFRTTFQPLWEPDHKIDRAVDSILKAQERTAEKPDHELSAEQLDDRYNPNGDGEHPIHTRTDWRAAVMADETISGYWDWLHHKLTS